MTEVVNNELLPLPADAVLMPAVIELAERIVGDMEPIIYDVIRALRLGGMFASDRDLVESAFASRLKIIANRSPNNGFWSFVAEARKTSASESEFWARLRGYYREAVRRSTMRRFQQSAAWKKRGIRVVSLTQILETGDERNCRSQLGDPNRCDGIAALGNRDEIDRLRSMLSDDELDWLVEHFVDELSFREMAEVHEVSEEAMKKRVQRVLHRLRRELDAA